MSSLTLSPVIRQQRQIAWLRIKMLLGFCTRFLALVFGGILMLFASFGLFRVLITLVVGKLEVGPFAFGSVALVLDGHRIDCTTWWGVGVLVAFHWFVLAWGMDFVRMGRGKRSASS